MTAREVPELASYESALREILQRWPIAGASMAISDNGSLVYTRGIRTGRSRELHPGPAGWLEIVIPVEAVSGEAESR